jgi:UDP-N-acetylglucosamine--N-acetylmuramyl-(pentapeptide) pyrophosphoryl-undecaprenol N-acetylglucosamine transferase
MRIILSAGGTAGHINPALAVADEVLRVFPESAVLFIGSPDGMEAKLVKQAGYPFQPLKTAGLQRKLSLKNIGRNAKALYYYVNAQTAVKRIIRNFKPDIVMGTGGYVSAPVVIAASKMGIKTATHESNTLPGVTTKLLSKYVDKIFVGSEDTKNRLKYPEKCVVTGNPLRGNLPFVSKEEAHKQLGLLPGKTILSLGGSLGANAISEAVLKLLKWENGKEINHIHSYGRNGKEFFESEMKKQGIPQNSNRIILREYIDNMYTCLSAADLVIARAGSMTITEIMASGKASVLIPFPQAAENHQYYNAKSMEKLGASVMILDKDLTPDSLLHIVSKLLTDDKTLNRMGQKARSAFQADSAGKILSEMLDLIHE